MLQGKHLNASDWTRNLRAFAQYSLGENYCCHLWLLRQWKAGEENKFLTMEWATIKKKREREREERGCGSEVSSTSLPPTPSTPALILSTATLPSPPHPFHSNTVHSNSISIMAFWIYSRKLARPMRPKKTPAWQAWLCLMILWCFISFFFFFFSFVILTGNSNNHSQSWGKDWYSFRFTFRKQDCFWKSENFTALTNRKKAYNVFYQLPIMLTVIFLVILIVKNI